MGIILWGPIAQQREGARRKALRAAKLGNKSRETRFIVCWWWGFVPWVLLVSLSTCTKGRPAAWCLLPTSILGGPGQYLQLYGEMALAGAEGRTLGIMEALQTYQSGCSHSLQSDAAGSNNTQHWHSTSSKHCVSNLRSSRRCSLQLGL